MKILDSHQMRALDEYTIRHEPIASIDLMERASACFVDRFKAYYPVTQQICVLAGPGNNGGDALAVARMLIDAGYRVSCYLVNPHSKLSPDCETNRQRLKDLSGLSLHEIRDDLSVVTIHKEDLVVDGLFGTGLNKPLGGLFAELVQYLNSSEAEVVSIDLPSGLFSEDNSSNTYETVVKASRTFTFQLPKLSFLLPDSGVYAGEWEVVDIGLSAEGVALADTPYYYTQEKDILPCLPKRSRFAYKNQFGHALLIAGSRGKAGAAVLNSKACLRSGVGLATAYVPAMVEPVVQTAVPEAMTLADPHPKRITACPDLAAYAAVAIGSGLGTHDDTAKALTEILSKCDKPVVLDADALNIISAHDEIRNHIPVGSILTPHVGEFERLAGKCRSSFERLQRAKQLASSWQCVVVLKGAHTAVCTPDGQTWLNSTGNPGMATAGSGDVLTGIIAGLLAQGLSPFNAARVGVFLHGQAGDKALAKRSQESLIAGDVLEEL